MQTLRATLLAAAAAGLLAGAASAGEGELVVIEQECQAQLRVSSAVCACIKDRARQELSDRQQEFMVAQLRSDQATANSLEGGMTTQEMTEVGNFMTTVVGQCGG